MYRLKDLREDHDLLQSDVAKLLNLSQQQYSKLERDVTDITGAQLLALSAFYGVSADYILGAAREPNRPCSENSHH